MIIEREDGFLAGDNSIPYLSSEIIVEGGEICGTGFLSMYQASEQVAVTKQQAAQLIEVLQKWVSGEEVE